MLSQSKSQKSFVETDDLILKSICKYKELNHSQNNFSKNNIGMLTLPDLKTYKATIIRIVW